MKIRSFFTVLAVLAVMISCSSKQESNTAENNPQTALTVDSCLSVAEKLAGDTVTVEGVCTHICKHGGRKIFLMGSDDTKMLRLESTEKTGAFAPECVNAVVTAKGVLVEEKIDEEFLAKWEQEVKAETAEKHGDDKTAGCASDQKAQNEAPANSVQERIDNFRKRIAERNEKEGKNYLSFFHIDVTDYKIAD